MVLTDGATIRRPFVSLSGCPCLERMGQGYAGFFDEGISGLSASRRIVQPPCGAERRGRDTEKALPGKRFLENVGAGRLSSARSVQGISGEQACRRVWSRHN